MSSIEAYVAGPPVPGDVFALLTDLQEMRPGLYMVRRMTEGWATLCHVMDDEIAERLLVTDTEYHIPIAALDLFMPIGIRLMAAG